MHTGKGERVRSEIFWHKDATKHEKGDPLDQGFPTCGTRTTGGTQTGARWYAERFQNKNLTIFC